MKIKKYAQAEMHYSFKAGTEHALLHETQPPRVGIYAGTFDPVHAGHIIFALKAQKIAGLERIYFMPERRPKRNTEAEHYVHRAVMLKHALKPHNQFSVLDVPDARLSVQSLPRIRKDMPDADLHLLTSASELLWHEGDLPKLYEQLHLIVAITSHTQLAEVLSRIHTSGRHFHNLTFVDISSDHVSSAAVRTGLRQGQLVHGLLPSVLRYAKHQWLYITPHQHQH